MESSMVRAGEVDLQYFSRGTGPETECCENLHRPDNTESFSSESSKGGNTGGIAYSPSRVIGAVLADRPVCPAVPLRPVMALEQVKRV